MIMATDTCPHISDNVIQLSLSDLCKLKQGQSCSECSLNGPNLWICLKKNCLNIGCSENCNDHSTTHFKHNHIHCVHMNLSSQRIWCYLCEKEVFVPNQRRSSLISNESDASRYSINDKMMSYDKSGGGGDSCDSSAEEEGSAPSLDGDRVYLNGLVGLQNIANTCYMNAALQALSNTPALTGFFLDCGAYVEMAMDSSSTSSGTGRGGAKPALAKSYHRLIKEMWCNKRRYVVPNGVLFGIRIVHPMFRGFQQHDTQEFLRCFMDQLHEELKEVTPPPPDKNNDNDGFLSPCSSPSPSQSEAEYETCDSGVSEQSSLSDDASVHSKPHRKMSRSPSPAITNQRQSLTKHSPIKSNNNKNCNSNRSNASTTNLPTMQNNNNNNNQNNNNNKDNKENLPKMSHRSIISDIFDGKLLSSVQCLTCDRISTREETFQDLSLPIPGKDHLTVLHQNQGNQSSPSPSPPPMPPNVGNNSGITCSDAVYQAAQSDGWLWWILNWVRSWFWGPAVSLYDCMAAFFSADELKGDNMYSCEKCNKLRNGVKYSRVLALPEILCVHLKRFRHDLSYSSKISSAVNFPLTGLNMQPYLHPDCKSEISMYDLSAVICHHGHFGSGHYTCFARHEPSGKWFEYDDQLVTQVTPEIVQNCEAYVLFYRKNNPQMMVLRSQALELADMHPQQASDIQFFVSKQWLNRFYTFAEPGPIDNWALLCPHGGLPPCKAALVPNLVVPLPQPLWDFLYQKFGGGPACNRLFECYTCKRVAESLSRRQHAELESFTVYHEEFQRENNPATIYAISMAWLRQWQQFARGMTSEEPGPINNSSIAMQSDVMTATTHIRNVRPGSDYAHLNTTLWRFFHDIYGGGPEIILRGDPPAVEEQARQQKQQSMEKEKERKERERRYTDRDDQDEDDMVDLHAKKSNSSRSGQLNSSSSGYFSGSLDSKLPSGTPSVNSSCATTTTTSSIKSVDRSEYGSSITKPVKSVSFEDYQSVPSSSGGSNGKDHSLKKSKYNDTVDKATVQPAAELTIGSNKKDRRGRSGIKVASTGLFGVAGKYTDYKHQNSTDNPVTNTIINSSLTTSTSLPSSSTNSPPQSILVTSQNGVTISNDIDEIMPLLHQTSISSNSLENLDDALSLNNSNSSSNTHHHHHHHHKKSSMRSSGGHDSGATSNGKHHRQSYRKKLKTKKMGHTEVNYSNENEK